MVMQSLHHCTKVELGPVERLDTLAGPTWTRKLKIRHDGGGTTDIDLFAEKPEQLALRGEVVVEAA